MTTIDYSKYTMDELLDVKNNIDPESPNYPALITELDSRKEELFEHQEMIRQESFDLAEKRVKLIGYFQIAAAIAIPIVLLLSENVSFLTIVIALIVVALNGFAGYTALKELKKFYWVSVFNQSLQVLSFGLGSVLLNYSGLGGVYLSITFAESTSFGLKANFSPGFLYQEYNGNIAEQFVAIDIMAIVFIAALVTVGSKANKLINAD